MSLGATYLATVRREPYIVTYWRLNDSSGSTYSPDNAAKYNLQAFYNGSPKPGPALIQNDSTAASYQFGATGASLSVADISNLRITGDMSIEAWIVPYAANQTAVFVGKMGTSGLVAGPYALGLSSGQISFRRGNGTTDGSLAGGFVPVGTPSHVVATAFRGTLSIYLNGAPINSGNYSGPSIADAGQSLYIGAMSAGTPFNGLLSEVAIYSGALSANRVARHFAVGQQIVADPAHVSTIDPPVYS